MDNHHEVTRRRFLTVLGGAASAIALSSCSDNQEAESALDIGLIGLFNPDGVLAAGTPQRVTFAIVGRDIGTVDDQAGLQCRLVKDASVVTEFSASAYLVPHDHQDGEAEVDHQHGELQRYYAAVLTFPEPGIYDIETTFASHIATLPVQAFDQSAVNVVSVGSVFPAVATPTAMDDLGVDPICTRAPESCGFHEHTPAQLLADGQPFAILVTSPAYCATSYCSSLLELLVAHQAAWPGIRFIHAEVYADAAAFGGDITNPEVRFAPIIDQLGLDVEPALVVVDSHGTITDRLDNVFGRLEFEAAVSQVLG